MIDETFAAVAVGALAGFAFALGLTMWMARRGDEPHLMPNETFEYTLDTGDILMLFRDGSTLIAVPKDDGRRADILSLSLADEVDYATARTAMAYAEQDGLRSTSV